MKHALRALQFFRSELDRMAVVLLLMLVSIGLNLLKPWPLALLIDSLFGTKALPAALQWLSGENDKLTLLLVLSLSTLALHLLQSGLSAAQNYLSIQISLAGLRRVREQVFSTLQRLSMRFHQGSRSGDLIYRATWDTFSIQTLFQQGFITAINASLSVTLMLVVMFRMNLVLTLIALTIVPVLVLTIRYFGRKMNERGLSAQQSDSAVTSFVQQSIVALPLIQSYTREEHEENAFSARAIAAQQKRLAQHGSELIYWLAIAIVFALGSAGMLWFGGRQVLAGHLTVGTLIIFLDYLRQLYEPLNQLSHVGATVATAQAGAQRVFEILDTPEEVRDRSSARPVIGGATAKVAGIATAVQARGNIHFDSASFGYQPGQPILQNISFRIEAGQSVAIIGPSGVGKTTLLNLLPRFFDPTAGAVKLEGVDLRDLRLRDLRRQISLVLQEGLLLPASIAENIAYGKPRASRAEIEAAARAANADKFIKKMPDGYATIVGDGGTRLSVGERQRVNLARAFLKDAPILLLDEPTSALDAESEALVVSSLFNLMKGRTTLMVAHRLSTIRQVDKVLVLQDGCLLEEGSPDELRERGGYYARVASGQLALD